MNCWQRQRKFSQKCVSGITADREKCRSNIERSLAIVTSLVPHIGYDRAAEVAKKAFEQGKPSKP
ncbi:MAG: hypothetical protein R2874_13710 [Desulfobacterales bacterium]